MRYRCRFATEWLRSGCFAAGIALLMPAAAAAQTRPPAQTKPKPAGPPYKWEITLHGGWATGAATPDGATRTPLSGPVFTMADGVTQTRQVASWFYGDGTTLLNQVLQLRGITARMAQLDDGDWPSATRLPGFEAGVRLARHLRGNTWFEMGVDVGLDPLGFEDDARSLIEETRASFESAFTALASSATPVASSTVTATAAPESGGRRLTVSAVLQYRGRERVKPFLLAGLGVTNPFGDPATLTLAGTYRFTLPGQAVVEETDTMQLRYNDKGSAVWILGAGVSPELTRRSGYRLEARVLFGSTTVTGLLDAEPARPSSGGALILNSTNPGLQLSSRSDIQPSLSGSVANFDAFTGEGRSIRWVLSAGYVLRF